MEEFYNSLASFPKEVIQWFILRLMQDNKICFTDVANMHVEYLESLRKGETQRLMELRSKIIDLWVGTKKELPSKLVALVQEGKDNGWVNIAQEKINNSKWQVNKL